ncbi:MAG TPA: MBL fold metallo-hydrolase [Burkholderiaceae bacterium]|nr:MBL fold metallo-hydrolase [Burkholderiaceae bacterium]
MTQDATATATDSIPPRADFGRVTVFFGEKNGKYPDGNQVVVRGTDTRVVFDSPPVANRIGPEFDNADLVVLGHVHEDHMAGLHRLPGVPVHVHVADLDAARSWEGLARHYGVAAHRQAAMRAKIERDYHYQERPDAIGYVDGAVWDVGGSRVRAIHMPGHTAGHTVLLVEPEGVAFIGDIDLTGFGPYYGDAASSLADFRTTLARLPDIPARVWVTSHHRGVYTDRAAMLAALAAFTAKLDEREQRLLELLAQQPRTLEELVTCRMMYPPDYEEIWVDDAERRSISQHLDELQARGAVNLDESRRFHLR